MLVTGEKTLELTNQDSMTFYLKDLSLDNLTGVAHVGFSGQNQSILFKFISGKIYDFEDRYVDSYKKNERMFISGGFNTTKYNYNINNKSICNVGQKSNFSIGHFYAKSENCNLNLDTTIYSDPISLSINFPDNFVLGDTLTGAFQNLSTNADITVSNTAVRGASTGQYQIISSPTTINHSTSSNIVVENMGGQEGVMPLQLQITTNAGDIYHNENLTAQQPVNYEISSFLNPQGEDQGALISGSAGDSAEGSYTYLLDVMSGNENISGETSVSLEYYSGKVGTYGSVTGVSFSSTGNGYDHQTMGGWVTLKFSAGLGSDVRASGYAELISGKINEDRVEIIELGSYFESTPTLEIVGELTGNNTYAGTGVALMDTYEKTFTGSWDFKTGTLSNLHDYRTNNLTGARAGVFYPSNLGAAKYVNEQTVNAPIQEDIDIKIINNKTRDKDYMLAKLTVSGGHPSVSDFFLDEIIITGGIS